MTVSHLSKRAMAFALIMSHSIFGHIPIHHPPASKPTQDVSVLGAPSAGPLVDGEMGSIHKGCRHRFYCYSKTSIQGFIGSKSNIEPLAIKDQPGVFPAPLMGLSSITFSFESEKNSPSFVPLIIRPDGTIFYGQLMKADDSPQTLEIASPAQRGIYSLMILPTDQTCNVAKASVKASVNTLPQEDQTFFLKSFSLYDPHEDREIVSAEFIHRGF